MLGKLQSTVASFDAFGHSLQINYRGEGQVKTSFGALCRLIMTALFLTLGIMGVLEVINY